MKSISNTARRKRAAFVRLFAAFALLHLIGAELFAQTAPVAENKAVSKIEAALDLGNPSSAKPDVLQPDNYLVLHMTFALSYNRARGAANWVGWHLTRSDVGTLERTNAFAPDQSLPKDWWIKPTDYTGSGYDRGHLCPSKDRSVSEEENRETFLMSNMQPQTPKLNQKTWKYLEDYTRETIKDDVEAYIYAGCYGDLGKIKEKITIPARCFKIIVVLPEGENDLKRIDKKTRIIAVDMPNDDSLSVRWRTYLTTVDAIEKQTGYDFLSSVPKKIQAVIEAVKDTDAVAASADAEPREPKSSNQEVPKPTEANNKPAATERVYIKGPRGGCYYLNESGKKVYVKDKNLCGN